MTGFGWGIIIAFFWIAFGIGFAREEILSTPQRNRTRDAWTRVRGTNVAGVAHFAPLNQAPRIVVDGDGNRHWITDSNTPMQFWTDSTGWAGPQQPEPIRDMELQPPATTMREVRDALERSPSIGQERET